MRSLGLSILSAILMASCGTSSSPAAPTTGVQLSSVAGRWSGPSSDTTGQETLTWTVTQLGTALAGTTSIGDTSRGLTGTGLMDGTVNGHSVTFQMQVPNGGFAGMMAPCSMSMNGQATMSEDGHTLTGTYSGNMNGMMAQMQSCGGAMSNGHFTLTR